jgi:ABC-type spermidine/putrescine transport system permease subunit II
MKKLRPLRLVVWLLIAFLYLPLVVVVIFAFNAGSNLNWPVQGLSLRWFIHVFSDSSFGSAFVTSFQTSLAVALICVVFSTAAAILFLRYPSQGSRLLERVALLPAMMPPLFLGVALFSTMALLAIRPGPPMMILGQVIVAIPFVLAVVVARLRQFDHDIESAARDLGAGPAQTFARITLPIILPSLLGAGLLAFAFSFDEVMVTNFTSGMTTTLPIYVFSRLHRSIDPSINAVATLLLAIPWVALLLAAPLTNWRRGLIAARDRG